MALLTAFCALLAAAAPASAQKAPSLEQAVPQARALVDQARQRQILGPDWDEGPELRGDLPNFHEVEPGFYRLAQPTPKGVRRLASEYHVRTILNLRLRVPREEARAAKAAGIRIRNVKMNGILLPLFREVDAALAVVSDPAQRPVAVHCLHGNDRTGVVVAAYEVVKRGRDPQAAADEAHHIGCCPPTFVVPLEKYLELYKRHAEGDLTVQEPADPLRR